MCCISQSGLVIKFLALTASSAKLGRCLCCPFCSLCWVSVVFDRLLTELCAFSSIWQFVSSVEYQTMDC